jgi:hypothetical protein
MYKDYREIEEQQEDQQENYENQLDRLEEQKRMGFDIDYPQAKDSESLYNLFHKTLKLDRSSKVGNLDKAELGMLPISVRAAQNLAQMGETLGHPIFAEYFRDYAEIMLKTSASKGGWFVNLFVSQKKFTARADRPLNPVDVGEMSQDMPEQTQKKKRFWKRS